MDQPQDQDYIISDWATMFAFSVLTGLIVAVVTFYFFGFRLFPVPVGSLFSGFSVGYQSFVKPLKPTWLRFTLCTFAGFVGWSLLFLVYH